MRNKIYATAVLLLSTMIALTSCKKEEKPAEPGFILDKWANATEKLDYRAYSSCEVNPKEVRVFAEMFRTYFIKDISIISVEKLDREDVRSNSAGHKYIKTDVSFSGIEISRKTKSPVQRLRGDVMFVKFLDGPKKDDGWLMFNRTLVRIKW